MVEDKTRRGPSRVGACVVPLRPARKSKVVLPSASLPSRDPMKSPAPAPKTPAKPAKRKAHARTVRLTASERARIAAIFARFEAATPAPKGELVSKNTFTLLVAVVLSAQATDKSQTMIELGEAGVSDLIKTIGLYRTKAKNVIALSRLLVERHGGETPLERAAMQALPGVGRKTASVVLNELGVEPAIAVDTHVFRVSHRLQLSKASTPDGVEQDLMARVPGPYLTRAHHWLILHGRYTCIARRPKCETCLISDLCPSRALFIGA
jgi:endonuclease-3